MASLFSRGFQGSKCKTLLKLTIPRIKLLRNKREVQLRQMRRDIAQLLKSGQELTARIRVEHVIREQNIMDAYEIIELFCELVVARLPIIESQRECPLDLKEAIASLCFAAPRCSDLPELVQIHNLFGIKYGKEFVAAAAELRPDCGVNRQVIEKLSVRAPPPDVKLELLKQIAAENNVEWDAAATESEFFKLHEDLLDGPNQFLSGSKVPLPEAKQHSHTDTSAMQSHEKDSEDDTDFDDFSLPSVPKQAVAENLKTEVNEQSLRPQSSNVDAVKDEEINDSVPRSPSLKSYVQVQNDESKAESDDVSAATGATATKLEQFVPFSLPPHLVQEKKSGNIPSPFFAASEGTVEPQGDEAQLGSMVLQYAKIPENKAPSKPSESTVSAERSKELQDILAAAETAAASADRAAAAAWAAADLAKLKVSEIIGERDPHELAAQKEAGGIDSPKNSTLQSGEALTGRERRDDIFDVNIDISSEISAKRNQTSNIYQSGLESTKTDTAETAEAHLSSASIDHANIFSSKTVGNTNNDTSGQRQYSFDEPTFEHQSSRNMQRSTSLEDDSYYSYPNLFGSHNTSSTRDE